MAPSFLYPEASEFRRRLPREIQRRLTFHHPHLRGYTAFKETIVVKPFGVLSGDTAMINTDHFDIGSVGEGVRAVWDTQAPAWRERLAERERRLRQEGPCADCSRWHTCRGGCPAAAFHQTGDVGHHDASCTQFRRTGLF
ncbi:MAG TPA: SPASM domain-containing protein [Arenibaculum sp.]|nr:SPASM domain-containing protein [Arenibaculum sp.]